MLCMNSYTQDYIDECRARVNAQLAAYQTLITTARKQTATDEKPLNMAIDSFEPVFFNNMVLVLDNLFVHRSRTLEGKDGNPLNEVRVLSNSLLNHNRKMMADKGIKLNPTQSILKIPIGAEIKLTEIDFIRLSKSFFAEMESKFCERSVSMA